MYRFPDSDRYSGNVPSSAAAASGNLASGSPPPGACLCGRRDMGSTFSSPSVRCRECYGLYHERCVHYHGDRSRYVCHICRFKKMDPFNQVVDGPLFVHVLVSGSNMKQQTLHLPRLVEWRRKNYEIWVRCLSTRDTSLTHTWPYELSIKVNDTVGGCVTETDRKSCALQLPQEAKIPKASPEKKRREEPLNLTKYFSAGQNQGNNRVEINWSIADEQVDRDGRRVTIRPAYIIGFFVAQRRTPADIEEVVRRQEISERDGLRRVLDLFRQNHDDEVTCVQGGRKVKLTCPNTLHRISIPARGRSCRHLQCFDLMGFLEITSTQRSFNNRWKCPCCHLVVRPADLTVDMWFKRLLADRQTANVDEIEITEDGRWQLPAPEDVRRGAQAVVKQEPFLGDVSRASAAAAAAPARLPKRQRSSPEVIDLEEESEPPTSRARHEPSSMAAPLPPPLLPPVLNGPRADQGVAESAHGHEHGHSAEQPRSHAQLDVSPPQLAPPVNDARAREVIDLESPSDDDERMQHAHAAAPRMHLNSRSGANPAGVGGGLYIDLSS
ncbi:unnamed protein product [Vitrella brassicaformis CCMP3155]|uniref:SP-RING-type domain-containing protein n=1 Tax=Vitrella brassicaformis (strain CCMP3155) TaxID=1169540 RepID=A0A0G4G7L6_VITBC|nr:unnamed protein product [Vitrella brassicaformis CCMP3155]|eukprot:CEM24689.1 unnamed protein product [Vitrella brassicaformis CCMP3155]